MLRLSDMDSVGRAVRQDDAEELGIPTPALIAEAIDAGRLEDAKALTEYGIPEGKSLHDLFCDWIWNLLTFLAEKHGEEEVYRALRATQGWLDVTPDVEGFSWHDRRTARAAQCRNDARPPVRPRSGWHGRDRRRRREVFDLHGSVRQRRPHAAR